MADRVLTLHRTELPTARQLGEQLLQQGTVATEPLLTALDPVLHTYALFNGFAEVRLAPSPSIDYVASVPPRAWAATRTLVGALDRVLTELVPEAAASAWCGHVVQHLHMAALGWRALGEVLAPRWQGERVHVLLPDRAYLFGAHSFVPGLVVSHALRNGGVSVHLYSSEPPPAEDPLLPDVLGSMADGDVDLLCHLPTCFRDAALFSREIAASGRRALVLPSQFYDVPTDGLPRCDLASPAQLARQLPDALLQRIDACMQRAHVLLVDQLAPMLPGTAYLHKQVAELVHALRGNALVFFTLVQRFQGRPPSQLLLSNHDTAIHGALFSFARRVGARLVLVPHAKIFNVPIKCRGQEVLCLTHPLQGGDVFDLYGRRMPSAALDFGETSHWPARPAAPLATLGIVLNSLSDMGLPVTEMDTYIAGLKALLAWCAERGVACRIRCRPDGNTLILVSGALRLPPEDLLQHQDGDLRSFGRGCDLVLGYDTPTSGAFELLEEGVPMIQALCRPLGAEEWSMVDPDVVPQQPLPEVVAQLQAFADDPMALWRWRVQQLAKFNAARATALPLRTWL